MDLWIRSQDKETLLLINTLAVAEDENGLILGYGIDGKVKIGLGKYKTKERALEVLDEIQDLFITKEALTTEFTKDGLTIMNKQPSSVVYEMPEE